MINQTQIVLENKIIYRKTIKRMTRYYISTLETNMAKENISPDFPLKKKVSSRKDKTE